MAYCTGMHMSSTFGDKPNRIHNHMGNWDLSTELIEDSKRNSPHVVTPCSLLNHATAQRTILPAILAPQVSDLVKSGICRTSVIGVDIFQIPASLARRHRATIASPIFAVLHKAAWGDEPHAFDIRIVDRVSRRALLVNQWLALDHGCVQHGLDVVNRNRGTTVTTTRQPASTLVHSFIVSWPILLVFIVSTGFPISFAVERLVIVAILLVILFLMALTVLRFVVVLTVSF
jgi:hypothetical protein